MEQFLTALLGFPAAIFTVLLALVVLYWLGVILGAMDLDLFGHGADHGIDGHHDGVDHGPDHAPGLVGQFFDFLSLGSVPITVTLSVWALLGWLITMSGQLLLAPYLPGFGVIALGLILLTASLLLGIPLAGLLVRPLRQVFAFAGGAEAGISIVGQSARITSVTCDQDFGTATCDSGGAELLLRVVSIRPDLRFAKGDQVVIADYDEERHVYLVGAAPHLNPVQPAKAAVPRPVAPAVPVPASPAELAARADAAAALPAAAAPAPSPTAPGRERAAQ